jgi:hypothetical protein
MFLLSITTRSVDARINSSPRALRQVHLFLEPGQTSASDAAGAAGDTAPAISVATIEAQLRSLVATARDLQSPVLTGALLSQLFTLVESGGYGELDYSVVGSTIYGGSSFRNECSMLHRCSNCCLCVGGFTIRVVSALFCQAECGPNRSAPEQISKKNLSL